MTTAPALTVPTVEIGTIRQHPANPRRNATADDAMVDSIATVGLYDPLMVAPDPERDGGWILIDGHRRLDGCLKAGLVTVPVNPRHDLVTEAQQLEVMVITGLQKEKLTPVEEAAAYEQLALAGMDVADIAASTGYSRKRIQGRLRLNTLSVETRDHLYLGEATLEDAEALLEFADQPDTLASLEQLLGTHNFRYEVQAARSDRDRRARNQALIDGFTEQGAKQAGEGDWRSLRSYYIDGQEKLATAEGHKGCLAWAGAVDSYSEPFLVCSKPTKHKTKKTEPVEEVEVVSDWEKREEERARAAAAAEAAMGARLDFLRSHLGALFPTKGNSKLADLTKALLPTLVIASTDAVEDRTLAAALDLAVDVAPGTYYQHLPAAKASYAAAVTAAPAAQSLSGFADYMAAVIVDQLAIEASWVETSDELQHLLVLWDWITAAGYTMSDADTAHRASLEAELARLDAEATDADGDA